MANYFIDLVRDAEYTAPITTEEREMVNTLRERLWDLRKRRIKIVEVAKLSGVSQSTFTKLMHEKNPVLNSDVLERIERAVSFYEKELEESDSKVAVG